MSRIKNRPYGGQRRRKSQRRQKDYQASTGGPARLKARIAADLESGAALAKLIPFNPSGPLVGRWGPFGGGSRVKSEGTGIGSRGRFQDGEVNNA